MSSLARTPPAANRKPVQVNGHATAKLLPHHLAELYASGLTDETIAKAGIYSEDNPRRVESHLGFPYKRTRGPAIVFPYHDDSGQQLLCRFKPDRAPKIRGKPAKYLSPRHAALHPYFPPGVPALLADLSRTLYLVEGEKKALCAAQHGLVAVGLQGVDCALQKRSVAKLIPGLQQIPLKGRKVIIVFDSDLSSKPQIGQSAYVLAAALTNAGAAVKLVRLPDGKSADGQTVKQGFDDFVVANGIDAFWPLVEAAEDPEAPAEGADKPPAITLEPANEGAAFLSTGKVDGLYRLRFWRGGFWLYQKGRYVQVQPSEIRAHLVCYLNQHYRHLNTSIVGNLLDQIKAQSLLPFDTEAPSWIEAGPPGWLAKETIAAANGLLHLPTLTSGEQDYLRPPSPRFFTTAALDYGFDPQAPRPSAWLAFLYQLWPDDPQSIETLRQWMGYTLSGDTSQHKFLLIVGPPRAGKGVILRVHRSLLGDGNCASPTFASLATPFGLWSLLGKSLATISDARLGHRTEIATVIERLLRITGEDDVEIERKFLEPLCCKLPTRISIVSNELPRLPDVSGAIVSRMLVLRLTETFLGKEDTKLTERLLAERPGILLWAIEGWCRLREAGAFKQPDTAFELLGDLKDLSSPISEFVKDCCDEGKEHSVQRSELFEAYTEWCKKKGRAHVEDEAGFGRSLRAAVRGIRDSQPRDGESGKRVRRYVGIGLKGLS